MRTIEDFLGFFRRQRSWTRSLIAVIPEERFDWRPADSAFSCGELVRHFVQSEAVWRKIIVEAATGGSFDPFGLAGDGKARMAAFRASNLASAAGGKQGNSFAECLEAWLPVQARTEEAFAAITPEQLAGAEVDHPLLAIRLPLWEALLTMVGHEVHHRGQLSAYLKMIGIEQPAALG